MGRRYEYAGYVEKKEVSRERQAELSRAGRDISPIPPVANPSRRAASLADLKIFLETYFPETFSLRWSDDHKKVIGKIQSSAIDGGLFALAMPRGSGKTSITERAILWAMLAGHRRFVVLVGPTEQHANESMATIKGELDGNELLLQDFPEVCYPIQKLEGITQRAKGQLLNGVRTMLGWKQREIIFPRVPGSVCAGSIIRVAGITGRIRGMKHLSPTGETIRPDYVFIDDPQTDDSARSPSQCDQRERVVSGAILGLAGAKKKIAGVMTVTVVCSDDLADRMLDKKKHPSWHGEKCKMVYQWPKNEKLWREYGDLRDIDLMNGGAGEAGTAFYREHRAEMDDGAIVAWPDRFNSDEISAIQHSWNLRLRNEATFFAEYQNEPIVDDGRSADAAKPETIAAKVNGLSRGTIPLNMTKVTAFVDVQLKALFWMVCAWSDTFDGAIIDYGVYPDQGRMFTTLRDIKKTMMRAHPGGGMESAIYAGLDSLTKRLCSIRYHRDKDGTEIGIERLLIDANWGESTDAIYQFCRASAYPDIIMPSHGKYVGAAGKPMSEYRKEPGDRLGWHWMIPALQRGKRQTRHVLIDTNHWKSFVHERMKTPLGDKGCLSFFSGQDHTILAAQLTAEKYVSTQGRGRNVQEWSLRDKTRDNHWFDCLVGCAAAASIQGVSMRIGGEPPAKAKTRGSIIDQMKKKRQEYERKYGRI